MQPVAKGQIAQNGSEKKDVNRDGSPVDKVVIKDDSHVLWGDYPQGEGGDRATSLELAFITLTKLFVANMIELTPLSPYTNHKPMTMPLNNCKIHLFSTSPNRKHGGWSGMGLIAQSAHTATWWITWPCIVPGSGLVNSFAFTLTQCTWTKAYGGQKEWFAVDRIAALTFLCELLWDCSGIEKPHQWQINKHTHKMGLCLRQLRNR